jgi:hypothetical protein
MDVLMIKDVARRLHEIFCGLQQGLKDGTLTEEELRQIDTLPEGECDKRSPTDGSLLSVEKVTGRSRVLGFPSMCCADTTAILGVIFMMMLVDSEKIIEVTATPKHENPQCNFHKWICVDGVGIDITLGQFYPDNAELKNAVLFSTHPFEKSGEYTIERKQFIPPPKDLVLFAEFLAINYIFPPDAVEVERK